MADDTSNTPIGGNSADDTKTRKTVRLHTTATPPPVADPLAARDTDTSNLEVLDDTQTRRTVKIKPIAPPTSTGMVKLPIAAENTNTRRTVVLRPQTNSADETNTRKTVILKPQTEEATPVSDETVAVPKPNMAPKAPVAIPPAPAAEVSDETVAVPKPKPAVTPEVTLPEGNIEDDDQTVKIKRPVAPPRIGPRPMGAPLPKGGLGVPARPAAPGLAGKTTVALNTAALGKSPAPAAAPAQELSTDTDDVKETVKLPQAARPAPAAVKPAPAPVAAKPAPAPAPVAAKPAAPAPAPVAAKPAPTSSPAAETVALTPTAIDDEITLAPSAKEKKAEAENEAQEDITINTANRKAEKVKAPASSASPFYLVIGLLTLALLLGLTALTLTQYLDFEQKIQIYEHIPGLPHAK